MDDFNTMFEPKIEVIEEVSFTPPKQEKPKKSEETEQVQQVQEPKINIEKSKNDKKVEQKKNKGGNPDGFFAKNNLEFSLPWPILLPL